MKFTVDLKSFNEAIEKKKIQMQEAARPAAQAGAQVIYDQARALVPVGDKAEHYFYGTSFKLNGKKYLFHSGDLKRSIFQRYQKEQSTPTHAIYNITYDSDIAAYAHMVELGTKHSAAIPFISGTFKTHGGKAQSAVIKRFGELIK